MVMPNLTWASVQRVMRFAVVSGAGLALDMAVFAVLIYVGVQPARANLVSASLAVTFVYFVSTRRVFEYAGRFLFELFAIYCLYQILAVAAASWAVGALAAAGLPALVAKVLILPVTFFANYLFMAFITRAKA